MTLISRLQCIKRRFMAAAAAAAAAAVAVTTGALLVAQWSSGERSIKVLMLYGSWGGGAKCNEGWGGNVGGSRFSNDRDANGNDDR